MADLSQENEKLIDKIIDVIIEPLDDWDLPEEQRLYMQITDEQRSQIRKLIQRKVDEKSTQYCRDHDFYCIHCNHWSTMEIQCPHCEEVYELRENEGPEVEQ